MFSLTWRGTFRTLLMHERPLLNLYFKRFLQVIKLAIAKIKTTENNRVICKRGLMWDDEMLC